MGPQGIWVLFYHDVGGLKCFLISPLIIQGISQIAVGIPCLRVKCEGAAQVGFGLLKAI